MLLLCWVQTPLTPTTNGFPGDGHELQRCSSSASSVASRAGAAAWRRGPASWRMDASASPVRVETAASDDEEEHWRRLVGLSQCARSRSPRASFLLSVYMKTEVWFRRKPDGCDQRLRFGEKRMWDPIALSPLTSHLVRASGSAWRCGCGPQSSKAVSSSRLKQLIRIAPWGVPEI